jgi:hypothetical protein
MRQRCRCAHAEALWTLVALRAALSAVEPRLGILAIKEDL